MPTGASHGRRPREHERQRRAGLAEGIAGQAHPLGQIPGDERIAEPAGQQRKPRRGTHRLSPLVSDVSDQPALTWEAP
jgi:hypothetical protein